MRSAHRQRARNMLLGGFIGLVLGTAVWLLFTGSSSTPQSSSALSVPTTRHVAEPAGPTPSQSAQMVCAPEAQKDIAKFIGQPTTTVTTPTWLDHLYSCRYAYPNGLIGLSVKELSNKSETTAYFSCCNPNSAPRSV